MLHGCCPRAKNSVSLDEANNILPVTPRALNRSALGKSAQSSESHLQMLMPFVPRARFLEALQSPGEPTAVFGQEGRVQSGVTTKPSQPSLAFYGEKRRAAAMVHC